MYAFYRQIDNDKVAVILNLSNQEQTVQLSGNGYEGIYTEVFSHQSTELRTDQTIMLKPWEYRVFTN